MGGLHACGGVMYMKPLAAKVPEKFIQVMNRDTAMNPVTIDYSVTGGSHPFPNTDASQQAKDEGQA